MLFLLLPVQSWAIGNQENELNQQLAEQQVEIWQKDAVISGQEYQLKAKDDIIANQKDRIFWDNIKETVLIVCVAIAVSK